MRFLFTKKIVQHFFRAVTFLCMSLVLVSLVLHTIDTNHTHPGHNEHSHSKSEALEVLSEYMHMGEKKFLFSLASIFSFPLSLPPTFTFSVFVALLLVQIWYRPVILFVLFWLRLLFNTGTLNPKVFRML